MVCAQKGYPLVVTMTETFSIERRKLMRFLGAKAVLTPAAEKRTSALSIKAIQLAEAHGWFLTRQSRMRPTLTCIRAPRPGRSWRISRASRSIIGSRDLVPGHVEGCCARSCEGKAGYEDHRLRARRRADAQQRDRARKKVDASPAAAHPAFKPHPMQGWSSRLTSSLQVTLSTWASSIASC